MKSAYELALERTGGKLKEISEDVKKKLSEIDAKCKAKLAEAELSADRRVAKAAGDPEKIAQIQEDLVVEKASIRDKCEREKNAVRNPQ